MNILNNIYFITFVLCFVGWFMSMLFWLMLTEESAWEYKPKSLIWGTTIISIIYISLYTYLVTT